MLSLNDPVHAYAIEALADEMRLSVEHVAEVYVVEWKRLAADARIDDYLPVLTAKAVKEALRVQRTELVAA